MWPPTFGSNLVSVMSAASRLCSGGLKSPKRSTKAVKASSIDASTTIWRRTTGSAGTCTPLLRLLRRLSDEFLVAAQRSIPKGVELVAQGKNCGFVEVVDAARTIRPLGDQSCVLQHF